jgi:hypothetical protein
MIDFYNLGYPVNSISAICPQESFIISISSVNYNLIFRFKTIDNTVPDANTGTI